MKRVARRVGVTAITVFLAAVPQVAASSPADELEAVELAFAATMADRDHAAFTELLDPEVVFLTGDTEIRGRERVAAAWAPYFEGDSAPFSWRPEAVTVLDSGRLGLTSGPIFDADGRRIGTFNSVWRRNDEGAWRIVFDRGCE